MPQPADPLGAQYGPRDGKVSLSRLRRVWSSAESLPQSVTRGRGRVGVYRPRGQPMLRGAGKACTYLGTQHHVGARASFTRQAWTLP